MSRAGAAQMRTEQPSQPNAVLRLVLSASLVCAPLCPAPLVAGQTAVAESALQWSSPPSATPNPVAVGQQVCFSAVADASGEVSYHWDFGDGTQAQGPAAAHSYNSPGVYTAAVIATCARLQISAQLNVTVASGKVPSVRLLSSGAASRGTQAAASIPTFSPFATAYYEVEGYSPGSATVVLSLGKLSIELETTVSSSNKFQFVVPPILKKSKFAGATAKLSLKQGEVISTPVKVRINDLPKLTQAPGVYIRSFLSAFQRILSQTQTNMKNKSVDTTANTAVLTKLSQSLGTLISTFETLDDKTLTQLTASERRDALCARKEADRLVAGLLEQMGKGGSERLNTACAKWLTALQGDDGAGIQSAEIEFKDAAFSALASLQASTSSLQRAAQSRDDLAVLGGAMGLILAGLNGGAAVAESAGIITGLVGITAACSVMVLVAFGVAAAYSYYDSGYSSETQRLVNEAGEVVVDVAVDQIRVPAIVDVIKNADSMRSNIEKLNGADGGTPATGTLYQLTVNFSGTGSGQVVYGGKQKGVYVTGSAFPGMSPMTFDAGTTVTVDAIADSGSRFEAWTQPSAVTAARISLTLVANMNVTAKFTKYESGVNGNYFGSTSSSSGGGGMLSFTISNGQVSVNLPDSGSGTVSGSNMNFTIPWFGMTFTGSISGTTASGSWTSSSGSGTWTANRN